LKKKSEAARISSREAEARKRALKRSGVMIDKGIDIPNALLDGLPAEVGAKLGEILGSKATTRDVLSAAVSGYLAEVVSGLLRLGIRRTRSGKQRPRKFDSVAWECLEAAESVAGLSKVLLLRACLSLLAERGVARVDLQAALDELTETARRHGGGPSEA
jgi:hypothetical protein